jgi:LuxR family maltose regulon positive regulatory protein
MVRTSARLLLGDVRSAAESAAVAAKLEPDRTAPWRPIVTNALGMTAYWSGASDEAVRAFSETVSAGPTVGNHTATIYALGYLAGIAAERADRLHAEDLATRSLALAAEHDLAEHWVTVMAHYALGRCARARGDLAEARAAVEGGLERARRGGLRLDTVYGLLELMQLAAIGGQTVEARDFYQRAARQLEACADPGFLGDRFANNRRLETPRTACRHTAGDELSTRELAVLRLMPTQLSLREIGNELYVSFNTVKTHARNIYAKLRVGSREAAVDRARELQLL